MQFVTYENLLSLSLVIISIIGLFFTALSIKKK